MTGLKTWLGNQGPRTQCRLHTSPRTLACIVHLSTCPRALMRSAAARFDANLPPVTGQGRGSAPSPALRSMRARTASRRTSCGGTGSENRSWAPMRYPHLSCHLRAGNPPHRGVLGWGRAHIRESAPAVCDLPLAGHQRRDRSSGRPGLQGESRSCSPVAMAN